MTQVALMWGLDDAIAGDMRGRDTIPGAETRFSAAFLYCMNAIFQIPFLVQALFPFFTDRATHVETYVSFIKDCGLEGANLLTITCTLGLNSLGALIATLAFEKKLTGNQARAALAAAMLVFFYDAVNLGLMAMKNPAAFLALDNDGAQYFLDVFEHFHVFEGTVATSAFTVLNALIQKGSMAKTGIKVIE